MRAVVIVSRGLARAIDDEARRGANGLMVAAPVRGVVFLGVDGVNG